jgi:hypothetical protein
VAYVGLLGLALAVVGVWVTWRRRQPGAALLVLALTGVFLAFGVYNPVYYLLYKVVPGFDLFRVPARWLLLYSFGAAILAGLGLEALPRLRFGHSVIAFLLVVELFVAGRKLAYNQPTAPAAFDSMRTAPAHLLADEAGEPFRFLSMSDILYDPGDLADLQAMYDVQLSDKAIYDLIVATKMKEVLAYNLPMHYRLYSVDGYDGGLLPIARYVTLERLFLAEEDIWSDGRLRQQLRHIPPIRLLSLLNVKYVITDKMQDVWIDDVCYDLEHTVPLGQVTLTDLPDFEATHLGLVSYLTDTVDLADGTPVARLTISSKDGTVAEATLVAGRDTAEGLYRARSVAHQQARVGHHWRDNELGNDYVTILGLERAIRPERIELRSLLPGERVQLRGLTLIDERTGTSRTVSVDPAYRLVHSGDVKIYQNLEVLPRAFVVPRMRQVTDDEEALAILQDPSFDPATSLVVTEGTNGEDVPQGESSTAEIVSYEPEQAQVRVSMKDAGWLVLTDTFYPGWTAEVDGERVPIHLADLYFRAVAVDSGEHEVLLRYQPTGTYISLALNLVGWLVWAITLAVLACHIGRRNPSSV